MFRHKKEKKHPFTFCSTFVSQKKEVMLFVNKYNKYSICFLYIRIKIYIANYDDSFSQIKHRFETITRKPIITPIISSRSYQQNEKKKKKKRIISQLQQKKEKNKIKIDEKFYSSPRKKYWKYRRWYTLTRNLREADAIEARCHTSSLESVAKFYRANRSRDGAAWEQHLE